jgi:hypothetical protein
MGIVSEEPANTIFWVGYTEERQQVILKRLYLCTKLHGITRQKTLILSKDDRILKFQAKFLTQYLPITKHEHEDDEFYQFSYSRAAVALIDFRRRDQLIMSHMSAYLHIPELLLVNLPMTHVSPRR